MAITHWVHFEERGGDPWVLPIFSSVHAAERVGKSQPLDRETAAIGEHISIKLNILPRIIWRINNETRAIYEVVEKHGDEHVFTKGHPAFAFPIDDELKYQLIADIEAFLFEANACWELIKKFVQNVYLLAGSKHSAEEVTALINAAHAKDNSDCDWIRLLDRDRNFVAHGGAVYLAVDVSEEKLWNLLVMKANLVEFDKPKKFFTLEDLIRINTGFLTAKQVLQGDLISLFEIETEHGKA